MQVSDQELKEHQVLDGKLNIKMRLGLPPLGIIGIPLTVTGTKDNPKVKVGKKGDEIEETKDTEE